MLSLDHILYLALTGLKNKQTNTSLQFSGIGCVEVWDFLLLFLFICFSQNRQVNQYSEHLCEQKVFTALACVFAINF